jgi:luciferase family oxidoreductase group 1
VPLYLLGSSDFSARLAAELGLPFAFASHFAPDYLQTALEIYRRAFKAETPHAIVAVNVFAAETDDEARVLFTSLQQQFLNLIRGIPGELQPPVADMRLRWSTAEEQHVRRMLRYSLVGSADTIRRVVDELIRETGADEIIATAQIFDHSARLRSFEIFAEVMKSRP